MDDGSNQHTLGLLVIKDHMQSMFMTADACGKIISFAAHERRVSQKLEAMDHAFLVFHGLRYLNI